MCTGVCVRALPQQPTGDTPVHHPKLEAAPAATHEKMTISCESFRVLVVALIMSAPVTTASSDSSGGTPVIHPQRIPFLGTFTVDGAHGPPIDLAATAERLIGELSWEYGVDAVNATLGVTATHSFHMFATNRTETCHFHPGTTVSTVLWGQGRFFSTNAKTSPQAQPTGSVFVIPPGSPHAFGHVGMPTIVTVAWSPPHHANYTIPATGCVGL